MSSVSSSPDRPERERSPHLGAASDLSSSPGRPATPSESASARNPLSSASATPEPFFAVKVGKWSWFCVWDTGETLTDGRGRYATAPQSPSQEDGRSPAHDANEGNPLKRTRTRAQALLHKFKDASCVRKLKFHADKIVHQFGACSLRPLESRRRRMLQLAMVLSEVGFVFAALGFLGGLMGGEATRYLNWMYIPKAGNIESNSFMGLRHLCYRPEANNTLVDTLACMRLSDLNCSTMVPDHVPNCQRCKSESLSLVIPMLIAVISTGKIAYSSVKRRKDQAPAAPGTKKFDTAFNKALTVVSALAGGSSEFYALMYYRYSCGRLAGDLRPGAGERHWGLGFFCMSLAVIMKLACGFVHASLVAVADFEAPDVEQKPNGFTQME